jgi:hypothetical protein
VTPLRLCLVCGVLTTGSRCPRHALPRRDRAAQARFRKAVLARDGHRCIRCGSTVRLEAHHLANRDDPRGVTLCTACHRGAHRAG